MKTITTLKFSSLPKTYSGLVALHVPRPIHDATTYDNAVEIVHALVGFKAEAKQRQQAVGVGIPGPHIRIVTTGRFAGAFEDDPEGGTSAAQALEIHGDLAGIFDSPKVAAAADSDRGAGLMLDDDADSI